MGTRNLYRNLGREDLSEDFSEAGAVADIPVNDAAVLEAGADSDAMAALDETNVEVEGANEDALAIVTQAEETGDLTEGQAASLEAYCNRMAMLDYPNWMSNITGQSGNRLSKESLGMRTAGESLTNTPSKRARILTFAKEGVWDNIKEAGRKFLAWLREQWKKIKAVLVAVFTSVGRLESAAKAMQKRGETNRTFREDALTEYKDSGLYVAFAGEKDQPVDVARVEFILKNTAEAINTGLKVGGNMANALATLTPIVKDDSGYLQAIGHSKTIFEKTVGEIGTEQVDEPAKLLGFSGAILKTAQTKELLYGKRLFGVAYVAEATTAADGASVKDKLTRVEIRLGSTTNTDLKEKDGTEVKLCSGAEVRSVAGEVAGMCATIKSVSTNSDFKKLQANIEKAIDSLTKGMIDKPGTDDKVAKNTKAAVTTLKETCRDATRAGKGAVEDTVKLAIKTGWMALRYCGHSMGQYKSA